MNSQYTFLVGLKLIVFLSFSLLSCAQQNAEGKLQNEYDPSVSQDKETILFIGNSHTYYNEGIATHLSRFVTNENSDSKPLIQDVAKGGFSLQDHLTDPETIAKIEERVWHSIVLQENTTVAAKTQPETIQAMEAIAAMVKQKGTKMYLFMTWPYRDEPNMLLGLHKTYEDGKLATGAAIVRVGQEWQSIDQNQEVAVNLYDPDGVHPSLEGSFYTAAMFYRTIYGKAPSDNLYQAGLSTEVAEYLKAKAD